MSNKEQDEIKNDQKVVTKYDRKLQKRMEEKEKEKKEKRISIIIGVCILAVLVGWLISIPIRTNISLKDEFISINDRKITKVEFDCNYYQMKADYLNQNGTILSQYLGIDIESDFSKEAYSDTQTWGDLFDEMAVGSIIRTMALKKQAEDAGFEYDTTEEYTEFEENIKAAAKEENLSVNKYLKKYYGPYATLSRISSFVKDSIYTTAYYDKIAEEKGPSDEQLKTYYEEHKDEYDSVDYRIKVINAALPTEPTDLADPVDETEEQNSEAAYVPSEAEVAKAMADAKVLAEEAEATVTEDGNLLQNVKRSSIVVSLRDWLFDSSRKAGDTTVIEESAGSKYYVLSFEDRYLDETPTADIRVLILENQDATPIFEEWTSGEATEDSFAALCDKYTTNTAVKGGLVEHVGRTGIAESLVDWLFVQEREIGDAEVIPVNDTYTYVIYYKGQNKPEWVIDADDKIVSNDMTEYMNEITVGFEVLDTKGHLKYLTQTDVEPTDANTEGSAESESNVESEDNADTEDSEESEDNADTESSAESEDNADTKNNEEL